jgi:hypothetical protein
MADSRQKSLKELIEIPGVGKSIAGNLWDIGIHNVSDLKNQDPSELYDLSNKFAGITQDRCLLYVFRCAVYYANTENLALDPQKLKWWYWKDRK